MKTRNTKRTQREMNHVGLAGAREDEHVVPARHEQRQEGEGGQQPRPQRRWRRRGLRHGGGRRVRAGCVVRVAGGEPRDEGVSFHVVDPHLLTTGEV